MKIMFRLASIAVFAALTAGCTKPLGCGTVERAQSLYRDRVILVRMTDGTSIQSWDAPALVQPGDQVCLAQRLGYILVTNWGTK